MLSFIRILPRPRGVKGNSDGVNGGSGHYRDRRERPRYFAFSVIKIRYSPHQIGRSNRFNSGTSGSGVLFWEIIPVVRVLTSRSPQRLISESNLDKLDFKTPRSARTTIDKANI